MAEAPFVYRMKYLTSLLQVTFNHASCHPLLCQLYVHSPADGTNLFRVRPMSLRNQWRLLTSVAVLLDMEILENIKAFKLDRRLIDCLVDVD